jgi:hypothetical protein
MKRQLKLLSIILLLTFMASILPLSPALAAPAIGLINPAVVVNNVDTSVTITGSGFDSTSTVTLGPSATISATFRPESGDLLATVPSGLSAGIYDVTVKNEDATSATLTDGLTIIEPTPTDVPTQTPVPFVRPQVVIFTYSINVSSVRYGQDFVMRMSLDNAGGSTAYGLQVTFNSADLLMLGNGGVVVTGDLGVVGKAEFSQKLTAAASLSGKDHVSLDMNVNYYDEKGTPYTDKFTLIFPVASSGNGSSYQPAPTATPTGIQRPQLVVLSYQTDVEPLQPGVQFTLSMLVDNTGSMAAKGITMIIGGGSSGGGSGTPSPGISAGNGEFANFAPVGSSNIQSLGDLYPGANIMASQKLVVNVSTSPGAYPMKVTFSYQDERGNPVNDEQVITLMVYRLPVVDISFYQPVGILFAGQPNALPLQVVSLGKSNVVLGKMKVETSGGLIENGEGLVGSLDPGGYFTLDAVVIPNGPGPLDLVVTIDYTDDFNQVRTITQTLTMDVSEMMMEPTPDMSNGGKGNVVYPTGPESFWQKVWRFILGLLGLDSSAGSSSPVNEGPTEVPVPNPYPYGGKG